MYLIFKYYLSSNIQLSFFTIGLRHVKVFTCEEFIRIHELVFIIMDFKEEIHYGSTICTETLPCSDHC